MSDSHTIIALAHSDDVANQLTLEWGVDPRTIPVSESVDDLIEQALLCAKNLVGLASGTRVRQAGVSGA